MQHMTEIVLMASKLHKGVVIISFGTLQKILGHSFLNPDARKLFVKVSF